MEKHGSEKITEIYEVAGANLNPLTKVDLLFGDKAVDWHIIKKFVAELYVHGLISAEYGNELLNKPAWWMNQVHVPRKLGILAKEDPKILWGVTTHATKKMVTESGKTIEEFKCDKILPFRDDEEKWHEVCLECNHYDKKEDRFKLSCPLRAEYYDEMKDITSGITHFKLERLYQDEGWVKIQAKNVNSAIYNSFKVSYPFIGYDEFVRLRGKKVVEMVQEELIKTLSDGAKDIEKRYRLSLLRLSKLRESKIDHPKYNRMKFYENIKKFREIEKNREKKRMSMRGG